VLAFDKRVVRCFVRFRAPLHRVLKRIIEIENKKL
jgi:hypothetical protein